MAVVRVTFYDNFREEDAANVSLSTVDIDNGIDIEVFASAGTWAFSFWYQDFPGDEDGRMDVGPFAWDVADSTLEAAIEAAFAAEHPTWVCNVEKVDGVYQVRFGTGDIFDHLPNAYESENINLSGYFITVWDEHDHDATLVPDPGCGAGAQPQIVPPGEAVPGEVKAGSVRVGHRVSGSKLS